MGIQVQSLSYAYGRQQVLQDVSFSIAEGTIVGLLGPNGAGKSTLMRLLTSYLPLQQGKVQVCGLQVGSAGKLLRQKIGYLPEHNPLYEDMYLRELLLFCGKLQGLGGRHLRARIEEVIASCGLEEMKHKKVQALSKGYRQRLGLARALLHKPEVLILDEPTSGLDPNQLLEVRKLIRELRRWMCVLFSTHVLQEVDAVCDEVILLHRGCVLTQETLAVFRRKYETEGLIEVEFVEEPPSLQPLEMLPGLERLQRVAAHRYLLQPKAGHQLLQAVLQACQQHSLQLRHLGEVTRSLEEIFQQLTTEKAPN